MKRIKKLLCLLLGCALAAGTLSGCGEAPVSSKEESKALTASDSSAQEGSNAHDPYTVKIMMLGDATADDCKAVAKAASQITLEKFNTDIELVRFGYGDFSDQRNLALSSGEKLDLMPSFGLTVVTAANNGQALPLDDLLKEYGKEMYEDISEEEWVCTSAGGKIYGVRNNKELGSGYGYAMSKKIVDEMKIDVSSIHSEDDMEAVLRQVKETYPTMYPLVSDRGTMGWYPGYYVDNLGGDFGVLEDCTKESTAVVNWYTSPTYEKLTTLRHKWVTEGLIMPDASTNAETAASLLASGKAFSRITNTKPGIEGELERDCGIGVVVAEISKPHVITNNLDNLWYIPSTSEKPERAMQVLNEIYTNPALTNILMNGIEGTHFVVTDKEQGIIDYPEGVNASTTGYSAAAWAWPNELISYVWAMDQPTLWKDTLAFNQSAIPSVVKGFVWDNKDVLSEIAACKNVKAKYESAMDCGELNPAEALPKIKKEYEDAGVNVIIEAKQAQLDAWLAANK